MRSATLGLIFVFAVSVFVAGCGGSSGGNNNSGNSFAPTLLNVGDCLILVYTDGSGSLNVFLTSTVVPSRLRYYFLDPGGVPSLPLNENNGTADWMYVPSGSTSTFTTPNIMDEAGSSLGTNTWTMNWTSTTGGTASDTGGDTVTFTYVPAGTGPAAASPYLVPGTRFILTYTAGASGTETYTALTSAGGLSWSGTGDFTGSGSGTYSYGPPSGAMATLGVNINVGAAFTDSFALVWTSRLGGTFTGNAGSGTFEYGKVP